MPAKQHSRTLEKAADTDSAVALRAFFRIARLWKLSAVEQVALLGVDLRTLRRWRRTSERELSEDTLKRLSHILAIYKALQLLLPDEKSADRWIKAPNEAPLFAGRPALERLLSGRLADLAVVRRYLEALSQGG